ncbi:hypothetical protein HXX76_015780 [Chlamydomonas incerta]|uniref:Methyltransferase FkbM domain-containing protein n=1 Tax=Chlamydomonas incerta TaxID=51695 RepID=A0A835SLB9_CHLIN|nr:hypothetical protein HXX76_015780 [Chlamydomonas incerta]|eukprot:KAG2422760.1 hypothetical protein HXX76_015780 [Chlamydomonas incerta]
MNSGYFTLLSAALGAHVYAFDLQVYCIKVVTELLRNKNPHLLSRIDIFNVGLGTPAVVKVPNNTCEGTFGTGGVASASSLLTAGEVVASIVNPANLLPTWRDEVTLVKIDTEGAEADILANLLPIVEAGSVKNIVVELIPAHWPSRGSSLEAGIKTMERLEALASRVVLLYDPVGFDFPKSPMKIAGFDGDLYTKFSVSALVRDRHDKKAGCNVWFTF